VVTAPDAVATEKDPQMSLSKTPTNTKLARAKSGANRAAKPGNIPAASTRGETKQEAIHGVAGFARALRLDPVAERRTLRDQRIDALAREPLGEFDDRRESDA
jgi:hypothetical protein